MGPFKTILEMNNNSQLTDILHQTPVASVTVTNTKWTGAQITVDATGNTITIVGHGLVDGNRVCFIPLTADFTLVPTGIASGYAYFVVGVLGDAFQVSLTSGGAAVDITAVGTPTGYQIEKLATSSMKIEGLDKDRVIISFKGAIVGNSGVGLNAKVNGVVDAVYTRLTAGTTLTNYILLMYSTSVYLLNCNYLIDLSVCGNSASLLMNGVALCADTTTPTIPKIPAPYLTTCITSKHASFSKVASFELYRDANYFFTDGSKLEVFSA